MIPDLRRPPRWPVAILLLGLAFPPAVSQPLPEEPGGVVLPGETPEEIVLSARGATERRVALAAAASLHRTPLRHTVRVVLSPDTGLGSQDGSRVLANLDLHALGRPGSAGPVLHILAVPKEDGERAFTPGWLVHALLRSGEAVGWPYEVTDGRVSLLGQLVVRSADVRLGSGGEAFLRRGIPAVTLSDCALLAGDPAGAVGQPDPRHLERWAEAVAAAVRRLDALAGRPLPEDQYLAAFGRVWLRRDLLWIGLLLWMLLVFRGRPGRWRGTPAEERRRQTRTYFPGFLFRVLLLLAVFFAPVFSVLLWPAALLALAPPRRTWTRVAWIAAGFLPLVVFLGVLGTASSQPVVHLEAGLQTGTSAAALILAVLASFAVTVASPRKAPGKSPDAAVP